MQWCNIEPHMVESLWPQAQKHMRRGMKRGHGDTLTEDGVLKALTEGRMQMLGLQGDDGTLVGSIILGLETRPKGPVLMILMVAVANKWIDEQADKAQEIITEYGRSIGAHKVETFARLGQVSRLKGMGWKSRAVVMELEI